jgi:hypothetical protein
MKFNLNMKRTILGFFATLLLAGSLFLTRCSDTCEDVACVTGECVEGDCICDAGYEGTDCGTAINAKFSGTYINNEGCSLSTPIFYTVTIAPKSGNPAEASITGLWEVAQASVTAKIAASGTSFTIENQPLGTSGFIVSSGNGSISADGNSITLAYTIVNAPGGPTFTETCNGYMSK